MNDRDDTYIHTYNLLNLQLKRIIIFYTVHIIPINTGPARVPPPPTHTARP